jgi:hypothetical protein
MTVLLNWVPVEDVDARWVVCSPESVQKFSARLSASHRTGERSEKRHQRAPIVGSQTYRMNHRIVIRIRTPTGVIESNDVL